MVSIDAISCRLLSDQTMKEQTVVFFLPPVKSLISLSMWSTEIWPPPHQPRHSDVSPLRRYDAPLMSPPGLSELIRIDKGRRGS